MRLYIIRHADPDYENKTITKAGHLEAQALAKRMVKEGLTHIYSSPLNRAYETMQYTSSLVGIDPIIQDWMQEINDARILVPDQYYQESTIAAWDIHGEAIRSIDPPPTRETWHKHPFIQGNPIVKKFEEIQHHSDTFLSEYGYDRHGGKYRIVRSNKNRIAVFCHNGLGLTWLAHLLEIPLTVFWAAFWLPPSSVTTILLDERSNEWATPRCISLGDTSHLYMDGLPVRPRGIIANFD